MNEFAWIISILIALGVAAVAGLHLYVYIGLWLAGIRLKVRLASQGRTLSLEQAHERIARGEGIIVVDSPTLGWNTARLWWAPEGSFVPRPESWEGESLCPGEDFTNHDHLIDPDTGIAKLIVPFVFTQRLSSFLKRHFELETYAYVFTGGVEFERAMTRRKLIRTER
jgi:hypothetical protein